MSALRELQDDFQAYILRAPNAAIARVVDAGNLAAEERLRVYADAYRLRLLEALETDFVALRAYLGSDDFTALGEAYIAASPSTHYSLRYFGGQLTDFLARTRPYSDAPLLAELAALDWALSAAFDAADDPVLTVEDLATVEAADWPNLAFRAHAALNRLDLHWNATAIWRAADGGTALPAPERAGTAVPWAIWRQNLQTFFRSLAPHEAYALDVLRRGDSFADICAGLCEWFDPSDAAPTAAGLLKQWIVDGMLSDFSA
jgi:hypothetical protein